MKSIFGYSEEEIDAVLAKVSGILKRDLPDFDSRNGATVHEHKRHLKDGRVITVRSYQRKK